MGGSLILFTLIIPTLLWSDMSNRFVLLATAVTAGYGVIGFIDDALKMRRKSSAGMPGRIKLLAQVVIAAAAVGYLYLGSDMMPEAFRYRLALPLLDFYTYDLRLTGGRLHRARDHRDRRRLQRGQPHRRPRRPRHRPVVLAAGTFLVLTYAAGTLIAGFDIARYLNIPAHPQRRRARDLLRSHVRRGHRLPLVQHLPCQRLHGRRRLLAARRRPRLPRRRLQERVHARHHRRDLRARGRVA
jgi:phospho-N-acetylmuramoyl-pentapeptide-transferase